MPGCRIVNVSNAVAYEHERAGTAVRFDTEEKPFQDIGVTLRRLAPGRPTSRYHSESVEKAFLVLAGECTAILDGEQHRLGVNELAARLGASVPRETSDPAEAYADRGGSFRPTRVSWPLA